MVKNKHTHTKRKTKKRESDPIVVFWPSLMKASELSVITEIGWHWAPGRMTMGHQQDHGQGLRTQPSSSPAPSQPCTFQPESPPGSLIWSPCSLSFKKLRPSAERRGHQTRGLQGTFPSGKTLPQTTEPPGQEVGVGDGRGSSGQLSVVNKAGRTSHPEKHLGIFSLELSRGLPFTETGTICPTHTPSPTGLLQHCSLSLWCGGSLSLASLKSGSTAAQPQTPSDMQLGPSSLSGPMPGQQVPKAWATARDEDELVVELANHLPLSVPGQVAQAINTTRFSHMALQGTDPQRLGWN